MATAFDRYRGESQGRVIPSNVDAVDGARVFVLGADGPTEAQLLSDGDYSQIEQTIDLTSLDLVGANMETIGVPMASFAYPVGLQAEADTLALWRMDYDFAAAGITPPGALNWIKPGPDLDGNGDLEAVLETYGPAGNRGLCRQIPVGSTTALLVGLNTPRIFSVPLTQYTFSVWLNYDADAWAAAHGGTSMGLAPPVFSVQTVGGGGLKLSLIGTPGVKEWVWGALHRDAAGTSYGRTFPAYPITTNLGWKLYTIVYDSAIAGADMLKLYVNGVYAASASSAIGDDPHPPALGEDLYVGNQDLWGQIDQVRLCSTAHSPAKVLADYDQCVDHPTVNAARWVMQVLIDGTVYAERAIAAGEARTWRDYYAPVRHLSGSHAVAFRLKLNEVT